MLGGPQSRSGRGGEEKNSQPLPGLEHPIIQPTITKTESMSSIDGIYLPESLLCARKVEVKLFFNWAPRHEGVLG
jgi:hypothetical protein